MQLESHEIGVVHAVVKLSDLSKVAVKKDLEEAGVNKMYFIAKKVVTVATALLKKDNVALDIYMLGVFLHYLQNAYPDFVKYPNEDFEKRSLMTGEVSVLSSCTMNRYYHLHQFLQKYDNRFGLELALEHIFFYNDDQILRFLSDVTELAVPAMRQAVLCDKTLWKRVLPVKEANWGKRLCPVVSRYVHDQRLEATKQLRSKKEARKQYVLQQVRKLKDLEMDIAKKAVRNRSDETLQSQLRIVRKDIANYEQELLTTLSEVFASEVVPPAPPLPPKTVIGIETSATEKKENKQPGSSSDVNVACSFSQMRLNAQYQRPIQQESASDSKASSVASCSQATQRSTATSHIPPATYYDYFSLISLMRLPRNIGIHWAWIREQKPENHVLRNIFEERTDIVRYIGLHFPALYSAIWLEGVATGAVGTRKDKRFKFKPIVEHTRYFMRDDTELKNGGQMAPHE